MSTLSNVTPQIGGFSLLYARLTSCVSSKKNTFGVSVRYVLEKTFIQPMSTLQSLIAVSKFRKKTVGKIFDDAFKGVIGRTARWLSNRKLGWLLMT